MTYPEIVDEINAFGRRREADFRDRERLRAKMDYQLAGLIGVAFNDPKKFPKTLKEAYPDLFGDTSCGWKQSKAQWQKFAEEFNRQREAKGK